ncbi:ABC transporter permease [Streptomyces corynorhini]|uniref:ABC transporter permease n=1 Tax=Streptomyces corynorhini TaxID=2282652 RepID=A0A370BGL7_9ACTN|nr:ABC transporter permease [Streptomyces corynorhini]RDG39802.1 ABC transporter permease [Streptomyces corynorhini]
MPEHAAHSNSPRAFRPDRAGPREPGTIQPEGPRRDGVDRLPEARELLRFSWQLYRVEDTPRVLVFSKIPRAVLQAVFYVLLGGLASGSAGLGTRASFVGVSAFVMCLSTVVGASGAPPLDRDERTLTPLLAGRIPPLRVFLAKCWPYAAEGWLISLFTIVVVGFLFTGPGTVAELLARSWMYAVMALTSTCAGAAVGVMAIMGRSELLLGNAMLYLILVLSGAVPTGAADLEWAHWAGRLLPLTNGIEALRRSLSGQPFLWQLLAELGVGLAWLALTAVLARIWARRTRTHGHTESG